MFTLPVVDLGFKGVYPQLVWRRERPGPLINHQPAYIVDVLARPGMFAGAQNVLYPTTMYMAAPEHSGTPNAPLHLWLARAHFRLEHSA